MYTDNLLASGERILRREHQHWFVLVWGARYALAALVLAAILLGLRAVMDPDLGNGPVGSLAGLLTLVLAVGGVIYLAWAYLRYQNEEYVITNRRIIHGEGVVNKRMTDSSLEKINDAILTQSLFGRMFGFGDLDVLTASETGIEHLRMLIDAPGFKRAMLDAKHELEIDLNRPVVPPFRSGGESRPAFPSNGNVPLRPIDPDIDTTVEPAFQGGPERPPAEPAPTVIDPAAAVPPKPQPSAMTADDVTRVLASLADLRDRGAITPEEFEAKKTELLARL